MGLFNKFKDTIFYKSDSELENQIRALKKVIEKFPNILELEKKLAMCELGLRGEKEIEFELKNANVGMYVLHDINLEFEDLKAQIDYIVITPAKIYFIECKNLTGNVTVNGNGEFMREWNYKGHKIQEGIYSPYRQAERHIDVFKKIWSSRNKGLLNRIRYNNMDDWYIPLVVMANSKNILNIKYAPKEIKQNIIRSDNLIRFIQSDIEKTSKDFIWSQKEMQELADGILKYYNISINKDYEKEYTDYAIKYVNKTKNNDNSTLGKKIDSDVEQNNLRDRLIEFRKKRAKEMNIPAYYVYTNDELEQLVLKCPKTIDELASLKILSPIKQKTHGQEIIKILKS